MFQSLRGSHAQKMIDNLLADGVQINHEDQVMLYAYIRGTVSALDLLAHARQFPTADAYHEWLNENSDLLVDIKSLAFSVKQVLKEFQNSIRRKYSDASATRTA